MKKTIANIVYLINKKFYYRLRYFTIRKHLPNFSSPRDISEYLLAEMLKPNFRRFADYADKVKVCDYVASKGLISILPQIYGIWDNANEIDFDKLPDTFVLKTNHGCGKHIFCQDKKMLDIPSIRKKINRLLSKKYSPREPHYRYITPKVFAEEYIFDSFGENLPIDYKILCVKGIPQAILVCTDRNSETNHCKFLSFSPNWEALNWIIQDKSTKTIPRPIHLEEMLEIAKKLSEDFEFVRVDLYDTSERIFFGELTFTPHAGFMTYFSQEAINT
ncbi:MAG: glycosyltransferase, partial [Porphyromonadaceae bacterium]|nr:glycosyltransferase [Porphyromonadaceae bacterium]